MFVQQRCKVEKQRFSLDPFKQPPARTLNLLKAPGICDGLGSHAFLLLFHLELAIARLQAGQSLQVDLCLTGLLKSFRIDHDGVLGPLLRPLSLHF